MGEKNSLLKAALYYAGMGYPIFPCWPGTDIRIPEYRSKGPLIKPEEIEKCWLKNPTANVAICTSGLSAIYVRLIDGKKNPWLENEPDKKLDLFMTSQVLEIPEGGTYFIFKEHKGSHWENTTSKLAPNVDTVGRGGYILVPPSIISV